MECKACNYKDVDFRDEDPYKSIKVGDRDFIEIKGSFHIEKDLNYGGTFDKKVLLYACPKCGTVRMQEY